MGEKVILKRHNIVLLILLVIVVELSRCEMHCVSKILLLEEKGLLRSYTHARRFYQSFNPKILKIYQVVALPPRAYEKWKVLLIKVGQGHHPVLVEIAR